MAILCVNVAVGQSSRAVVKNFGDPEAAGEIFGEAEQVHAGERRLVQMDLPACGCDSRRVALRADCGLRELAGQTSRHRTNRRGERPGGCKGGGDGSGHTARHRVRGGVADAVGEELSDARALP